MLVMYIPVALFFTLSMQFDYVVPPPHFCTIVHKPISFDFVILNCIPHITNKMSILLIFICYKNKSSAMSLCHRNHVIYCRCFHCI